MDVRIRAADYHMSAEAEAYLIDRLRTLERLIGDKGGVARCEAEIGRDAGRPRHGKNIWFAEVRIVIPGEDSVYARNNSESVNGAIDDVKEEVERQLRKKKRRDIHMARRIGARMKGWLRWGTE